MNHLLYEKYLNFLSAMAFIVFLAISVFLFKLFDIPLGNISALDGIVLVLATYRISRMLGYEKVFSIVRFYLRKYDKNMFIRSVYNLISCPWCTGVWMSLIVFDIFFLIPYGYLFIYLMAISALASPLVLLSNNLTLRNDLLKMKRDKQLKDN